jgi:hypothetical protein
MDRSKSLRIFLIDPHFQFNLNLGLRQCFSPLLKSELSVTDHDSDIPLERTLM